MAMDAEISDRPKAFYEGLPSMNGPPEAGMQVAYRIVELEDSGPKVGLQARFTLHLITFVGN